MTSTNILVLALLALAAAAYLRRIFLLRSITSYEAPALRGRLKEKSAVTVLDVRTAGERSRNHIRGSVHIPLHELTRRAGELEKFRATEIVCYCQTGSRSLSAAHKLRRLGYRTANLSGGISAWMLGE